MSRPFDSVAIIGVGLIGGSLGAALKALPDAPRITGIARDERTRELAVARGVVDAAVAPEAADAALLAADLVVIATPVGAAAEWLQRLGKLFELGAADQRLASIALQAGIATKAL